MAKESGREIVNLVHLPNSEVTSTCPFSLSTLARTTSSPTPRPETSVTVPLVLNPGKKMRSRRWTWVQSATSCSSTSPLSIAAFCRRSGSMPWPSSSRINSTLPPSCLAPSLMVPVSVLPDLRRALGVSMPWSRAFRSKWTRGSPICSRMRLSMVVCSPSTLKLTFLPNCRLRSRTALGKVFNTSASGSMRISMLRC